MQSALLNALAAGNGNGNGWQAPTSAQDGQSARLSWLLIQLALPQRLHARRVPRKVESLKAVQQVGAAVGRQLQPAGVEGGRAGLSPSVGWGGTNLGGRKWARHASHLH